MNLADVKLVSVIGGQNQSGPAGVALPQPCVARVVNGSGQPLGGVTVSFSAEAGAIASASAGGFSSALSLSTDADGQARIYVRPAGTEGAINRVVCSVAGAASVYIIAVVQAPVGVPQPGGVAQINGPFDNDVHDDGPDSSEIPVPVILGITCDDKIEYDEDWLYYSAEYDEDYGHVKEKWEVTHGKGSIPDETAPTIQWSGVSMPAGVNFEYQLQWCEANKVNEEIESNWNKVDIGRATTYKHSGLKSNVCYRYRVRVVVINNNGKNDYGRYSDKMNYEVPLIKWKEWYVEFDHGGSKGSFTSHHAPYFVYYPWPVDTKIKVTSVFYPTSGGKVRYWDVDEQQPEYETFDIETNGGKLSTELKKETMVGGYALAPEFSLTDFRGSTTYGKLSPGGLLTNSNRYGNFSRGMGKTFTVHISGSGASHFSVSNGDNDISDGQTVEISSFIVIAKNNAEDGDEIIISVEAKDGSGRDIYGDLTQAARFTYREQEEEPDDSPFNSQSLNLDEASGPRYRKVTLNGLPMSDEQPQRSAETDREKEETFIDALTLGLRHSTTDNYQTVSGADFALQVRRDHKPEVWSLRYGLKPGEEPQRPFGLCWTSNLASYIEFVRSKNRNKTQPDRAIVVDENGATHVFAILSQKVEGEDGEERIEVGFFPMPQSRNEQQAPHLEMLRSVAGGYEFTSKYGSVLRFEPVSLARRVAEPRGWEPSSSTTYDYARLVMMTDRVGNQLEYQYEANNLVPKIINAGGQRVLSIRQNTGGLVTDIWDAKGQRTIYEYADGTNASGAGLLRRVIMPDGQERRYAYNIVTENDSTPRPATSPPNLYWHAELSKIEVVEGGQSLAYQFTHAIDTSKQDYLKDRNMPFEGYYTKSGLPRNVTSVSLPDGGQVCCVNGNANAPIKLTPGGGFSGQRWNQIQDAGGRWRTYHFTDAAVVLLPQLPSLTGDRVSSMVVCYQGLTVDYGTEGSERFEFDLMAGMALKKTVDWSGNATEYEYADPWEASLEYQMVMGLMSGASFNGNYNDPTRESRELK